MTLHLHGREVQVFCLPTSQGVVVVIAESTGVSRCLPTWGAPACNFGAPTLVVARKVTEPRNPNRDLTALPLLPLLLFLTGNRGNTTSRQTPS